MRIPHKDKVIYQTFNVNKVELTWLFPENKLFIFGIHKDGSIYGQAGDVNDANDWVNGSPMMDFTYASDLVTSGFQELWYYPNEFDFFGQGETLLPLIEDIIEFLK